MKRQWRGRDWTQEVNRGLDHASWQPGDLLEWRRVESVYVLVKEEGGGADGEKFVYADDIMVLLCP